jgi:MFS family permease
MKRKWPVIVLLALSECLAMGLWFSASAVTPVLIHEWQLSQGAAAWLTLSVQIGFVVGALVSALLNLADLLPARLVMAAGALLGAAANAWIAAYVDHLTPALLMRFATGAFLALVYPTGMKIIASWMKEDRGLGLGILVGALTLGTASPHLLRALGGLQQWRPLMYVSSALAIAGALIVLLFGHLGPYRAPTPKFNWHYVAEALRHRGVRLANFGYLGHMWELYAMWTWLPIFILESYRERGLPAGHAGMTTEAAAALIAFAAIAAGGLGSLLAGYLADQWGRSRTTIASMAISGACAVLIGPLYGYSLVAGGITAVVWGFAIVADSAQFSASVSELCKREYTGTALTLQTSMGFLLTLVSIRLVPTFVSKVGWVWAFAMLSAGPLFGIWSMWQLLRSEDAAKMAGGRG